MIQKLYQAHWPAYIQRYIIDQYFSLSALLHATSRRGPRSKQGPVKLLLESRGSTTPILLHQLDKMAIIEGLLACLYGPG